MKDGESMRVGMMMQVYPANDWSRRPSLIFSSLHEERERDREREREREGGDVSLPSK